MKKLLSFLLAIVCLCASACVIPAGSNASAIAADDAGEVLVPVNDIDAVYIDISTSIIRESYRSCTIRVVDIYGRTVEDTGSSIKIRGNSTSSGAKKPYNFKFSGKTDILGLGKAKKWCLLANCYEKTLIRNEMVFDFARNSTCLEYTPDSKFVDVYLNGVLQGNYILCEAVEAGSTRVDIDTDNNEFLLERDVRDDEGTVYFTSPVFGIRFGINEPEEPTAEQLQWLMDFLTKAENALKSKNMTEVEKYFDIDSIIDFYIIMEYFKQVDVSVGSTRFYIKGGKIYGGPVWDFDLTMGNCLSSYYTAYNNVGGSGKSCEGIYCNVDWFYRFNSINAFVEKRNARYLELQDAIVNLYTDTGKGENYMDKTIEANELSFNRNYKEAGWKIDIAYNTFERLPDKTYEENVQYLRTWLEERNEWLLKNWNLTTKAYVNPYSSSGLEIDGAFIYGLEEKLTEKDCEKLFNNTVSVDSAYTYVGTGATVKNQGLSYTFVVKGDINGNGKVDANDYLIARRTVLLTYEPSELSLEAADVDGSGSVTATDYLMIRRHVIGRLDIYGE